MEPIEGDSILVPLIPAEGEVKQEDVPKAPLYASMVNVANCIVGGGVLTFPGAVSKIGLGLGWIILLTFASK